MKQIGAIAKIVGALAYVAGIALAQTVGSFTGTGSLITPRQFDTATLLTNGKVLLAGGISAYGPNAPGLSSAELYDPSTGTFSATGKMTVPRVSHTATLLPDGRVLVAGGYSATAEGLLRAPAPQPNCTIPTRDICADRPDVCAPLLAFCNPTH